MAHRKILPDEHPGQKANSSTSNCLTTLAQASPNNVTTTNELDETLAYSTTKRSIKSRLLKEFQIIKKEGSEGPEQSFHTTDVVKRKNKTYILKYNPVNSVMSEFEPANNGFFRMFVPDLVPTTFNPVLDDKNFPNLDVIGNVSCLLDGFEDIIKKPLLMEDLKIEALEQRRINITEAESILQECYNRYNKKIDDIPDNEQLIFNLENRQVALKGSDIKHFEIVSRNGLMWMFNFLLEDDDPHRKNIAKNGKRIDFDMTAWPVSSKYKNCNIVDRHQRLPTQDTFALSAKLIENFPLLEQKGQGPHHWPTKPLAKATKITIEALQGALKPLVSFSQNAFTEEDKQKYSQFVSHEVFIHYKFVALTMFCLSNANMFYNVADLYINRNVTIDGTTDGKPLVRHIAEHFGQRIDACRCVIASMPSYRAFLQQYGARVKKTFMEHLKNQNVVITTKIEKKLKKDSDFLKKYPEYEKQIVDLTAIEQSFMDLEALCDQERISRERTNILFNITTSPKPPGKVKSQ